MFNILVTDDEQIVIDSLSFIINKNFADEAKVFTALSGTEAIEIVMKENIDIMFMDINMPGLSGLETVSVITKLKPNIVFVILSAFDRFQYAQEAINLGAYKYIIILSHQILPNKKTDLIIPSHYHISAHFSII